MNIFKEMVLSIYDFKSYKKFLDNKKSKVFFFGVMLMFFYFILTMIIPFARFQISTGGIRVIAEEFIPDFELKNGTMWMAETVDYDDGNVLLYIDTTPGDFFYSASEMAPLLRGYSSVIIIDSEKMIVKSDGTVQDIHFSDITFDFSRTSMLGLLPYLYAFIALFMVLAFLFKTAFFFFGVLFVALIGMIAASCMKYQLSFGQLYLLGIYSRTLPLLIKAVLSFLPFSIPFFWIFNFGLSVFYIILAIQKMKIQQVAKPLEFNSTINDQF